MRRFASALDALAEAIERALFTPGIRGISARNRSSLSGGGLGGLFVDSTGMSSVLAHVDFGAIALVSNLIHQRIDQINPAAVVGENVLAIGGTRELCGVKTISGIAHDDDDSAVFVARHGTFDSLGWVCFATMENGVSQRLTKRHLNLKFLALAIFHLAYQVHHPINDRGDGAYIGRQHHLKVRG
jgi:hypothetical protein